MANQICILLKLLVENVPKERLIITFELLQLRLSYFGVWQPVLCTFVSVVWRHSQLSAAPIHYSKRDTKIELHFEQFWGTNFKHFWIQIFMEFKIRRKCLSSVKKGISISLRTKKCEMRYFIFVHSVFKNHFQNCFQF